MKSFLVIACLYCVFANTPIHLPQGSEIPEKLFNVSIYDYMDDLRKKSPFYNEIFPESGRQLNVKLQMLKSEGERFCDYYWKYTVLPGLYKEYISFDNNKSKSIIILTYNKTDSDDYLIDVMITQMDEFISEDLIEHLIYLPQKSGDSKIGEKCRKYCDLLHQSMMGRNFNDLSKMVEEDIKSMGFQNNEQNNQTIMGIKNAFDIFNSMTEKFVLTAEKQYLGCYEIGKDLYSTHLLIHTKKCGYGVITLLMAKKGDKAYLKNISLLFNQKQIFRNIPDLLMLNRP